MQSALTSASAITDIAVDDQVMWPSLTFESVNREINRECLEEGCISKQRPERPNGTER